MFEFMPDDVRRDLGLENSRCCGRSSGGRLTAVVACDGKSRFRKPGVNGNGLRRGRLSPGVQHAASASARIHSELDILKT